MMTRTMHAFSMGLGGMMLAAGLAPAPALAQPQCGARDAIIAVLAERYGETRRSMGVAQNAVMEIFASAETGSWTIAVTTPDGTMCLVAAGLEYQAIEEQLPAKGSKV